MLKYFHVVLLLTFYSQARQPTPSNIDSSIKKADQIRNHDPKAAIALLNQVKPQLDSVLRPAQYGYWALSRGAIADAHDDYKTALAFFNEAVQCFKKVHDQAGISKAYNNIGGAWYSMNDFDQALQFLNEAAVIRKDIKDEQLSSTYSNIGIIYYERGNYVEALKNYQAGIKAAEKFNNIHDMASLSTNICVVYWDQKDYEHAIPYANNALKYHSLLNNYQGMATACNNIGGLFIDQGQYDKALPYIYKAIAYAQKIDYLTAPGISYNNLAEIAYAKNDFESALKFAIKGLDIRRKIGKNAGIIRSLIKVSEANTALKNISAGETNLNEALNLALTGGDLLQTKRIYQKFSVFYKDQGKFQKALEYHEKFQKASDSLFNANNMRTLNEMQTRFETQKKQQQIKLLGEQAIVQQLSISRRNILAGVIGALLIVTIIAGFIFYNSYKLKQEARLQREVLRQQEIAAKGVIEAEERERKRIAGDLHDGVGQLFSAVRLNLGSLFDKLPEYEPNTAALAEKTLALVDESCREVRTMAHQMMPNILLKTGLASAVRDFVTKIDEKKLKINLETSGLDDRLDDNIEIVLYRVIQECVNNVIKHAAAARLDIQLHKDSNEISATIEDNGKGFDTTDKDNFEGIGLKNIVSRLAYLKGTVDFSSSPGKGTLVAIYVPLG